MLVLALDTATPTVTAGVVRLDGDGRVREISSRATVDARAHAELLTPYLVDCLTEAGVGPEAVEAVVVGTGPGPFTGLRVGMATGAAFADALGVDVHGVCSLDAIAARARAVGHTGRLLVVTDARRREAYHGRYHDGGRVAGPAVGAASTVDTEGVQVVVGDAARVSELPPAAGWVVDTGVRAPDPASLVTVAAPALLAGTPPAPLEPLYLRRPDAVAPRPRPLSPALRDAGGEAG